ncbi:basic amino acid ABC transporter substrate-binding protein [Niameybacter massiliensis]|uniref:Basic amino acid ABC transporter substrate-binding protein n=1 Tax=Holtiella tumoricola TaxID=3018743 RepID=A0AA42J1A3_9FIRM|nr:basic amino acid ABC transporter substrate-binding protein [Holtiella tumoricola]MDA3732229.1 basic amino acid ABC transporter substrate-binding protein [Holtiella tumoricola]
MKKFMKISAVILAGVLSLGTFVGCGKQDSNVIVMGTNPTFPPFEDIQGDEIVGFDVEISKLVAEKLGKELKIEDMEFGQLLGAASSGKIDFIAAGMTATEDRAKQVDFSVPYFESKQVIIVAEDNDSITQAEDLEGKKVGVQLGTTGDLFVSGYESDAGATIDVVQFDKGAMAVADLSIGKIDAVVLDEEPAKKIVANYKGVKLVEAPFIEEVYAIAVKKGNAELLNTINEVLNEIQENGTYDALYAEYFGVTE